VEFKSIVGGLSQPAIFGRTVNSYEIVNAPDGRQQVNLFMSRAAFSDLDLEGFRHAVRAKIPDSGSIRIHAVLAPRCFVNFIADDSRGKVGFILTGSCATIPERPGRWPVIFNIN